MHLSKEAKLILKQQQSDDPAKPADALPGKLRLAAREKSLSVTKPVPQAGTEIRDVVMLQFANNISALVTVTPLSPTTSACKEEASLRPQKVPGIDAPSSEVEEARTLTKSSAIAFRTPAHLLNCD